MGQGAPAQAGAELRMKESYEVRPSRSLRPRVMRRDGQRSGRSVTEAHPGQFMDGCRFQNATPRWGISFGAPGGAEGTLQSQLPRPAPARLRVRLECPPG